MVMAVMKNIPMDRVNIVLCKSYILFLLILNAKKRLARCKQNNVSTTYLLSITLTDLLNPSCTSSSFITAKCCKTIYH